MEIPLLLIVVLSLLILFLLYYAHRTHKKDKLNNNSNYMSLEENKAIVRRMIEAFNKDLAVLASLSLGVHQ